MIRKAKQKDLKDLYDLELTSFDYDRISLAKYKRLHKKNSAAIFVLTHESLAVIASVVVFCRKKSESARIYSFAVHKDHRQKKVAKTLYAHVESFLKENGFKIIILEVSINNIPAIKFYTKLGFSEFGSYLHYYEDGSNAIRMRKVL